MQSPNLATVHNGQSAASPQKDHNVSTSSNAHHFYHASSAPIFVAVNDSQSRKQRIPDGLRGDRLGLKPCLLLSP